MKILKAVLTASVWTGIALASLLILVTAVLPIARGLIPITALSSSMSAGGIQAGDLIFAKEVTDFAKEVHVGDVVTVMPKHNDPTLVTHRVVDIAYGPLGPVVTTRGDSNDTDDAPVAAGSVRAVLADVSFGPWSTPFVIPKIGEPYIAWQGWKSNTGVQDAIPYLAWTLIAGGGVWFLVTLLPHRPRKARHREQLPEVLVEAETGV